MIYSGLTLVSRFMGFLRDLVVGYKIGASASAAGDAYNTALAFPNLFRRIFAEGAFAAAFVPAYSKSLEANGEEVADKLAADAMATLAAATIGITLIADLAMPWVMMAINPGYVHDKVKFELAVTVTRWSMPYLPCMAIVAHLSGVLNARGRFILSAAAPTLLNLMMLAFILPQQTSRDAALWASYGTLAAGVAQAGLLTWGVRKSGAQVHWRLPTLTPEVKELIKLAIPGAIAASATQINIFISGILASQVNGARSWLATADRLYQLPLGLVGVAIGVALLPRLSRAVHAGDKQGGQDALDEALTFAMALTLPAAVALFAMPMYLIDGLYTRGEFHTFDAQQTANALFFYGLGTPAFVLTRILAPAFFARQDTASPMRFALISVAVNIAAGLALFYWIGFQGIAAGTAIASWLTVVQMLAALARRGEFKLGAQAASRILRVALASAVMGAALYAAQYFRFDYVQPLFDGFSIGFGGHKAIGPKEISLGVVSMLGGGLYLALLFGTGAVKLSELKAAMKRGPKPVEDAMGKTPAGPDLL
ncbi:MAG: murein biosynthesis integral membrane protein MurJ [Proteobacteria bacterium]|nr:murein biosynthesis integral membrane protein MurJ [Pseudomonadota bacterium]